MSNLPARLPDPPQWTRAFLSRVLVRSAMCSSILGDLHEEFVRDVRRLGLRRANRLYRRRALGVAVYAVRDSLCLREWTRRPRARFAASDPDRPDAPALPDGLADPRFLAVVVLALGIGMNTLAYRVVASSLPHWFVSFVGAVSFLFLVACAALASGLVCQALRRRGMRSEP